MSVGSGQRLVSAKSTPQSANPVRHAPDQPILARGPVGVEQRVEGALLGGIGLIEGRRDDAHPEAKLAQKLDPATRTIEGPVPPVLS